MNSTQMACLQKLVNALQECEDVGVSFSHSYLRLDVEDDESHYLENISSKKLSELLNFVDGCGVFKTDYERIDLSIDSFVGFDDGYRVGDYSSYIEIEEGVVKKWDVIE